MSVAPDIASSNEVRKSQVKCDKCDNNHLMTMQIGSTMASTPEAQDALFHQDSPDGRPKISILDNVPAELSRASLRLRYPPSYAIVGVYRLCTDSNLYIPTWNKCKHATTRGLIVGAVWVSHS